METNAETGDGAVPGLSHVLTMLLLLLATTTMFRADVELLIAQVLMQSQLPVRAGLPGRL